MIQIRDEMNKWILNKKVPNYVNEVKLIPLSKEENNFPKIGNVRTLAASQGIKKVFETIILRRLET